MYKSERFIHHCQLSTLQLGAPNGSKPKRTYGDRRLALAVSAVFAGLPQALLICAMVLTGTGCGSKGGQQTQLTPAAQSTPPAIAPGDAKPPNSGAGPIHPQNPSPVNPAPVDPEPVVPPSSPNPNPVNPEPSPPVDPVVINPIGPPAEPKPADLVPADPQIAPSTPAPIVIEGPHQSDRLQAALDNLKPGDTLIIRAGDGVYRSESLSGASGLGGFILSRSGTAQAPIRIVGEGIGMQRRPIIDQGVRLEPAASNATVPVVGLYLHCVSHVQVENLEIRNAQTAGITTAMGGCRTEQLQLINNHIHHIHGSGAVAGIRLWGAKNVLIKENKIEEIINTAPGSALPPIAAAPSLPEAEADNSDNNIEISHNDFADTFTGIQLLALEDSNLQSVQIKANQFHNHQIAIAAGTGQGASSLPFAAIKGVGVLGNLMHNVEHGAHIDLGDSKRQSADWLFANNTFSQCRSSALTFSAVEQLSFINNLIYNHQMDALVNLKPANPTLVARLSNWDYNLYWRTSLEGPHTAWLYAVGAAPSKQWTTLDAWQTALNYDLQGYLSQPPDIHSLVADPMFADGQHANFTPQNPLVLTAGDKGGPIGAFAPGLRPGVSGQAAP